MVWLGCDLGTSSLKVLIAADDGTTLYTGDVAYPTDRLDAAGVEQNPSDWVAALAAAIRAIPAHLRDAVAGIGIDGHVPSLVTLDESGEPTHASLIWQDSRPTDEAALLADTIGDPVDAIGIRLPWNASQLPAKALWFSRHRADAAARTRWLASPKDYLNFALTGRIASDPWTAKGLSNVRTRQPATEVLAAAGWTDEHLPPLGKPWDTLGEVTTSAAERFGLRPGIPVAFGWTDAMAAALASDVFERPTGMLHTGTSEIIGASAHHAEDVSEVYLVPREVAPLALSYGPTRLSGGSVVWVSRLIGKDVGSALDLAAHADEARPLFLPYLGGERAPVWDTEVRGMFLGLEDRHGPAELAAAVIDGVALSAWHVLSTAERATGTTVEDIQVGGRGTDHPAWLRARSGALGRTLVLHAEQSLAAWGAAQLAALCAGSPMPGASTRGATARHEPGDDGGLWEERRGAYLDAVDVALGWAHR